MLRGAYAEGLHSRTVQIRELEFNCFDVIFDFYREVVTVQDALSADDDAWVEIPMAEFVFVCGL